MASQGVSDAENAQSVLWALEGHVLKAPQRILWVECRNAAPARSRIRWRYEHYEYRGAHLLSGENGPWEITDEKWNGKSYIQRRSYDVFKNCCDF